MSRRKRRVPRPVRVPTLLAMHVTPVLGISQETALVGLMDGWAGEAQFNTLAECCNMLGHGATVKQDAEAQHVVDLGSMALDNIRDRYLAKGRMGATSDELKALRAMVEFSTDWWNRQGGTIFQQAFDAMNAENEALEKAG